MRYTSPSFEEVALTAAPYRGYGEGCEDVNVGRRCDQGYKVAGLGGPIGRDRGGVCYIEREDMLARRRLQSSSNRGQVIADKM